MLSFVKDSIKQVLKANGFDIVRIGPPLTKSPKSLKAESVPGWFAPHECRGLYLLAALANGPILEIGHFLGRSTACICEAIHDTQKPREFRSYDLGFRSEAEFKAFYDKICKAEIDVPDLFKELVYSKNATTTAIALQNLKALQLDSYVTLISGNAFELDHAKYDMIFCDATHNPNEIAANIPHIIARSNPGCVWAFHDMDLDKRNVDMVLDLAKAEYIDLIGALGIFVYKGK